MCYLQSLRAQDLVCLASRRTSILFLTKYEMFPQVKVENVGMCDMLGAISKPFGGRI